MNTDFPIEQYREAVAEIRLRTTVEDCVLFVGSSTFTIWRQEDMDRQLAPVVTQNVAFGGSTAYEILHYYDDLIRDRKCRAVVWYEGDNDLCGGFSPEEAFAFSVAVFDRIRADYGRIPLVLLSTKISPLRLGFADRVDAYNAMLERYARVRGYARYVDVNRAMVAPDGVPRSELFQPDNIHFNKKGYEELAALLRPILLAL